MEGSPGRVDSIAEFGSVRVKLATSGTDVLPPDCKVSLGKDIDIDTRSRMTLVSEEDEGIALVGARV